MPVSAPLAEDANKVNPSAGDASESGFVQHKGVLYGFAVDQLTCLHSSIGDSVRCDVYTGIIIKSPITKPIRPQKGNSNSRTSEASRGKILHLNLPVAAVYAVYPAQRVSRSGTPG